MLGKKKKQESTIARLNRAYLALEKSYKDLKKSNDKMMKREKMRYKFFTKMLKGVKVLKPHDRLASP